MSTPGRLAATAVGLALLWPTLSVADSAPSASGPIEEAREAARRVPFSARVEVAWVDHAGLHTAELGVRSVGGRIRIQGPARTTGGAGMTTVMLDGGLSGESGQAGLLSPALARKYEMVRRAGPTVAGRATNEVVLRSDGEVRERLAIDRETGLVLQREVFGAEGRPVRVVRVLQLDTAPVPDSAAPGVPHAGRPRALQVSALSSAYPAPDGLAGGYRRVAAYRRSRMVHLLYTDGLHGMSLFSQPGELRMGALPSGGDAVQVGTSAGVRYTWPGGEVVTWQDGPLVHTLVGDGPPDDLVAAARSLPRPGRPSLVTRLRGTARLVTELVSGGR